MTPFTERTMQSPQGEAPGGAPPLASLGERAQMPATVHGPGRRPREVISTVFLDGCRGLAALYVVFGHARYLAWEGYSGGFVQHPDLYSPAGRIVAKALNVFAFGHAAVLFFFVLSGFVIHLRYARAMVAAGPPKPFGLGGFVLRRARRLYPPFLFSLALALVLYCIGSRAGYSIYSQSTPYRVINDNVTGDARPLTLIGNVFFLMKAYVPVYCLNGPLWSLKYEWWFYMAYPLFWRASRASQWGAMACVAAAALLVYPLTSPYLTLIRQVMVMFPVWWMGVVLADVHAGRMNARFRSIAPLVLGFLAAPLLPAESLIQDYMIGLGMTGLIAAGFAWQESGRSLAWLERTKWLGSMSYTLYVTHFPIMVILCGFLIHASPEGLLPRRFEYLLLVPALCVAFAFGAHLFLERPFTASDHSGGAKHRRASRPVTAAAPALAATAFEGQEAASV